MIWWTLLQKKKVKSRGQGLLVVLYFSITSKFERSCFIHHIDIELWLVQNTLALAFAASTYVYEYSSD